MLFGLGRTVATPGAIRVMENRNVNPSTFLSRHASGDWGDLDDEDKQSNDDAILNGGRIFSAYKLSDGLKIWVITEAEDDNGHRIATTILLPSDY